MEANEFDQELAEFELRLERLRALYEQYFLGIERIEPGVARKDVDRRCYQLRRVKLRNTAKRFKLQTLIQRYNTLQQYWAKVCRQIENGQYTRHLVRAERRFGVAGHKLKAAETERDSAQNLAALPEPDLGAMLEESFDADAELRNALHEVDALEVRRSPTSETSASPKAPPALARPKSSGPTPNRLPPGAPPRPGQPQTRRPLPPPRAGSSAQDPAGAPGNPSPALPPPRRAPPATQAPATASAENRPAPPARRPKPASNPGSQAGLSDDKVHSLYDSLVSERKKLNQKVDLSEAALAKSLRNTEAKLRAQYAGKDVDFKVAVKDGKAIIKPVVR